MPAVDRAVKLRTLAANRRGDLEFTRSFDDFALSISSYESAGARKIMKYSRLNISLLNKRGVGKRNELYNIVDSSQQVVLTIQKQENSFFLFSCCIER